MVSITCVYIILLITGIISGQKVRSNTLQRRQFYRDPRSKLYDNNVYNNYSPNRLVQQQRTVQNPRHNHVKKQIDPNYYNTYDINNNNPYNTKKYKKVKKRKRIIPTTTTTQHTDTDTDTDSDSDSDSADDADYSDLYNDIKNVDHGIEITDIESNENDNNILIKNHDKIFSNVDNIVYDNDDENIQINTPVLKQKIKHKQEHTLELQSDTNEFDNIDDYDTFVENKIKLIKTDSMSNPTDKNNIKTVIKNDDNESDDNIDGNLIKNASKLKQIIQNKKYISSDQESISESESKSESDLYIKKTSELKPKPQNEHKYAIPDDNIFAVQKQKHTDEIRAETDEQVFGDNDNVFTVQKQKQTDEIGTETDEQVFGDNMGAENNDISMVLPVIHNDKIDLSLLCNIGNGTKLNPWIITQNILYKSIIKLSENIRSIYFPSGYYYSYKPIHIYINYDSNSILQNGIRIYGHYVYWRFNDNNSSKPSLYIEWKNNNKINLFNWEFSGIEMNGNAKYELVKMRCNNCSLNNFIIDLKVNNGYKMNNNNDVSNAIGIRLVNILQSNIKLIATCIHGIAFYLDNGKYNNIFGTFSNGLIGYDSVYLNSICLYLLDVVSNTFLSVNMEYCYDGIYFVNNTYGNVFNTLISNNEDNRGNVISLSENKFEKVTNVINYLVIHMSIQGNNSYPKLWGVDYSQNIKIISKAQI